MEHATEHSTQQQGEQGAQHVPSSVQQRLQQHGSEQASIFATAPWLTIITGHYGVGKTNLSLNIVRDIRAIVDRVTLIDLDIVNPYFRSSDSKDFLDAQDINVFGPVYARSTLDTPSLAPGIDEAIGAANSEHAVLIDVGGDPDGARALGRYAEKIAGRPHKLVYVVNMHRPETATVQESIELLRAIEEISGLTVTHIVGNTHLKELSTAADIAAAIEPTREIARAAGVELAAITVPQALAQELETLLTSVAFSEEERVVVYPVDTLVTTPWEQ